MNVKVHFGLLVSACLAFGRTAPAQTWNSAGPPPSSGGTVVPVQYAAPGPYGHPPGYGHSAPAPYCLPDANIYSELLPEDRFSLQPEEQDLLRVCREALRGTYFRVEYLNGEIFRHDQRTLGERLDLPGRTPPEDPFILPNTDNLFSSLVQIPTTRDLNWDELSGIKGTLGLPIWKTGGIEMSFWGLEDTSDDLNVPDLPNATFLTDPAQVNQLGNRILLNNFTILRFRNGPNGTEIPTILATTLTTDGAPGNRAILYDAAFFSSYSSSVWSMEVNYVHDLHIPGDGFTFKPLIGYRHEEYGERLTFGGTFDNRSQFLADPITGLPLVLANPVSNLIDSKVYNFRDALQLGFRSELPIHDRVQLGVEPKVALGANLIRSSVETSNVREPGDPNLILQPTNVVDDPDHTRDADRELEFAPSVDVGLYANVRVTDWFKMRVGYNFVWMGRLGVADDSIRFNEIVTNVDNTDPLNPIITSQQDVGLRRALRDRNIGVFTIGGEVTLP